MSNIQAMAIEGLALFNNGQLPEAERIFHSIVKQKENYAWAHAHLAETHATIAKTQHGSQNYTQTVGEAIKHFLIAILGQEAPRSGPGKLDLDDLKKLLHKTNSKSTNLSEAALNVSWAWAHLGELLRTLANQSWRIENNSFTDSKEAKLLPGLDSLFEQKKGPVTVQDLYDAAVGCFEQAIELRRDGDAGYAWAIAHRAATWCNSRQEDKYDEALEQLEVALRMKDGYYPWATAYKAAAHLLKEDMSLAFFNLFEALLQDPELITNAVRPFAQYNTKPSASVLYGMALYDFASVREMDVEVSTRYYYQKYYQLVLQALELAAMERKGQWLAEPTEVAFFSAAKQALSNDLEKAHSMAPQHQYYLQAALKILEHVNFNTMSLESDTSEAPLDLLKKAVEATKDNGSARAQIRERAINDVVWFPYHNNPTFLDIVDLHNHSDVI